MRGFRVGAALVVAAALAAQPATAAAQSLLGRPFEDVVRYLAGVVDNDEAVGKVFEIGGADQLSYLEMLQQAAEVMNGRRVPILTVPVITPKLSSYWISYVTSADATTGRNLIDSMSTEVLVQDTSIREVVPGEPLPYRESVRRALQERSEQQG